jgi:REP element-mobilizing transposase RayT
LRLYQQNETAKMTDKFKNKYRIQTVRATWHDYKNGSYFVTICTKDREPYFGHIVDGQMSYTDLGISANDCLQAIPSHFPDTEIPEWIVMPNHIHAIIIINAPAPVVETQNLASPLQQTTHHSKTQILAPHQLETTDNETQNFASLQGEPLQKFGPQSKNLASIIRGFKIGVTKYANEHNLSFAWQSRFHDHIIRNQYEMNRIADYINNNVVRWKGDCYNQNANNRNAILPEEAYLQYF